MNNFTRNFAPGSTSRPDAAGSRPSTNTSGPTNNPGHPGNEIPSSNTHSSNTQGSQPGSDNRLELPRHERTHDNLMRQDERQPGPRMPYTDIGSSDLNPLGGGFPSQGGGMTVGPDHPMFRQGGAGRGGFGPGIPGGPEMLPRGAVPPGARFDPIGPFGQMPGPARPAPRGGPGGNNGFFSGEPNPDTDGPPNSSWNYYM
ncbi:hypothetical protein GGI07_001055 [Coemansia sp. Benny D115]|nr:hypothetical protein GGI07_001055 [Coemansia sp. Benny D115]